MNLNDPIIVTRVATQGYGGPVGIGQWVEKYRLSWEDEEGTWHNYSHPHRASSSAVQWKNKVIYFS